MKRIRVFSLAALPVLITQCAPGGCAPAPAGPPASSCNPNYSPCVPNDPVDVDCANGSGDGPSYVSGPVNVTGVDVYGLDGDGNGVGCENG